MGTKEITIKEKAAVHARISELNTHKQSVTDLGSAVTAQITALTSALTATAGASAEPVPSGIRDSVQAKFTATAETVGSASGKLQSWLDGQTVIDDEGADTVTGGSDGASKPTPAPASTPAKPVPNYQLK